MPKYRINFEAVLQKNRIIEAVNTEEARAIAWKMLQDREIEFLNDEEIVIGGMDGIVFDRIEVGNISEVEEITY
jgi:hypothetical protein